MTNKEALQKIKEGSRDIPSILKVLESDIEIVTRCPDCIYYEAPICNLYGRGDMVSREGYCYHARRSDD